jgi:hypothetical protein
MTTTLMLMPNSLSLSVVLVFVVVVQMEGMKQASKQLVFVCFFLLWRK